MYKAQVCNWVNVFFTGMCLSTGGGVGISGPRSLLHPAETSNNSDICDFLKVSDIENCMVVNGKMFILNHSS